MDNRTTYTVIYDKQYKHYAVMFRTKKGAISWLQNEIETNTITGILIHHNLTDTLAWTNPELDQKWIEGVLDDWKTKKSNLPPRKRLIKILVNCQKCPYSRYQKISDPNNIKFGYICTKVKPTKEIYEVTPEDNYKLKKVTIPEWCPLGDYVSSNKHISLN